MVLRGVIFIQAATIAAFILIMFQTSYADKCLLGTDQTKSSAISDMDRCFNFSELNREKKEFYSPSYPNNYPNNTKCTLQIRADHGNIIQIDFLDEFKMENSPTCEYDRLVVRDGPYGYSPCHDVYCGQNFPPKITSSGQYLWLQFESDASIEYTGFRAVYRFIKSSNEGIQKPPIDECIFQRTGPSGKIGLFDIQPQRYEYAKKYDDPIDCTWKIIAPPDWKISMTIPIFELEEPNNCDVNYIEIFNRSQDEKSLAKFCGTSAEPQRTASNIAYIRYFSRRTNANKTNFELTYTTIRELNETGQCDSSGEFDCNDRSCINKNLVCDSNNDCKYGNDEDQAMCKKETETKTSVHMIVILVVFFILVITMCASISISCYSKVKERSPQATESEEASVKGNTDRSVPENSNPLSETVFSAQGITQRLSNLADDDDDSSRGSYVQDYDLSDSRKHPNGGESISRGIDGRSVSRGTTQPDIHRQQNPYVSQSIDSLQSRMFVTPTPPPVPVHKEHHEGSQPPSYRFAGGRAVAEINKQPTERRFEPHVKQTKDSAAKTPTDYKSPQRGQGRYLPEGTLQGQARNPLDNKPSGLMPSKGVSDINETRNAFLRGPLEAGVPRSAYARNPAEIGLPKFGAARMIPDAPRGPLALGTERSAPLATFKSPESYRDSPYVTSNRTNLSRNYRHNPQEEITAPKQFRTQAMADNSEIDTSRPDSVDSTQSAPDVIANR